MGDVTTRYVCHYNRIYHYTHENGPGSNIARLSGTELFVCVMSVCRWSPCPWPVVDWTGLWGSVPSDVLSQLGWGEVHKPGNMPSECEVCCHHAELYIHTCVPVDSVHRDITHCNISRKMGHVEVMLKFDLLLVQPYNTTQVSHVFLTSHVLHTSFMEGF